MRKHGTVIGLLAVVALSGCESAGLVSSWKAPDAQPFQMSGENVAAVVMVQDVSIRLAGEQALARELTARGVRGVPMHSLVPGGAMDEGKARAAAEQAGIVGVVALRPVRIDKELSSRQAYATPMPGAFWGGYYGAGWGGAWSGTEIRTDTIVIVETLVYSLRENRLLWSGQSKTTNPANLDRLIENAARQVCAELERQGLITNARS
jgi:outer membrane lipoprotein SlyB